MSDDTQNQKPGGFLYRATEIGLGIASAASLVMSFTGLSFFGAIIQGGITVVQTGMDLVTKGFKKAAITFSSGALLTAVSFIPFLRAAEDLKDAAQGSAIAGKAATGVWGSITQFFGKAKNAIGGKITWAADNTLGRIPFVKTNFVAAQEKSKSMATKFAEYKSVAPVAKWLQAKPKAAMAAEFGTMGVATAIGMAAGADTPPTNLLNPDTYRSAPPQQEGEWAKRIRAERAANQQLAANGADNNR
jgi:hypothetical protein